MTYKIKIQREPTVFIAIPIGWTKEYCLNYMLGALYNLDYNPRFFKVVFAVTDLEDEQSKQFIQHLQGLIDNSNLMFQTEVIVTKPTPHEQEEWKVYANIIVNQRALRHKFLKENYEYMLVLGGDNPPPRSTIRRLLKLNTDVASALLFQRPIKSIMAHHASHPLVFRHVWSLKHLEHNGFNKEQKRLLTKAWVSLGFVRLISVEPDWQKYTVVEDVASGDGCSLIKRKVLETVDYHVSGYQSTDLQFFQEVLASGFHTAVDMKLHCPHVGEDGLAY